MMVGRNSLREFLHRVARYTRDIDSYSTYVGLIRGPP